jgi:uncharacterized membrane protein
MSVFLIYFMEYLKSVLKVYFNAFLSGLFILLPLGGTLVLLIWLLGFLDGLIGPSSFLGSLWKGVFALLPIGDTGRLLLGYLVVFVVIGFVGFVARGFVKEKLLSILRNFFSKIPVLNKIYGSIEQLVGLWVDKKESDVASVGEVVMVNFSNVRVFGILSSSQEYKMNGEVYFLVYIPSAPVPATGFTYFVKKADVMKTDVGMEEMTKVIVSLGVLGPDVVGEDVQLSALGKS